MGLSILNNIPSLEAQNQLAMTSTNLQNTLFQLSTGSKINSGADDPAGLSIADSLQANVQALTQSAQNVSDGVGLLQTADGALSQVTTLLNRAVTLATEAANTGLTQGPGSQQAALQNEFASITAEIDQIGSNTTYNNTPVFSGSQMSVFLSDGSAADAQDPTISVNMPTLSSSALGLASYATGTLDLTANPTSGNTVQIGTQTYTFVAAGQANAAGDVALGNNVQSTLQNLQAAVNGGAGAGSLYGSGTAVNQQATITSVNGGSAVVQALQAGTAGNSVNLSTSITSNVGSGGGTTLSGGKNATYDSGTLSLLANPSLAAVATGSITFSGQPDTLTSATGDFTITTNTGLAGQTVTVGAQTYTFMANGATNALANQVAVGSSAGDIQDTLANLAAAINGTITAASPGMTNWTGTDHAASGASGATASYSGTGGQLVLTANTPGTAGNGGGADQVAFSSTVANAANPNGGPGYLGGGMNADTVTAGGTTYTFVANGQAAQAGQVSLGVAGGGLTAAQATLKNLMNAINDTGTAGAGTYGAETAANSYVQATTISGNTLNLQAIDNGAVYAGAGGGSVGTTGYGNNANLVASAPVDGAITVSGSGTLTGGANSDTVNIGNQVYTFVASGTAQSGNGNEVALGSTPQGTLNNLMAAVNAAATGAGANGSYYVTTTQSGNSGAQITSVANGVATVQSLTSGIFAAATNAIAISGQFQNGNATGTFGGLTEAGLAGGTASTTATGMAEFTANPLNGDSLVIGANTYSFVTSGSATTSTASTAEVAIANTLQGTLANLKAAINTGGAGTASTYDAANTAAAAVTVTSINDGQVLLTSTTANSATPNGTVLQVGTGSSGNFTAGSAGGGAAAANASGYLALNSNPTNGNTVTIGNVTYTFTSGTPTSDNQVALGQTINGTLTNLADAVNYANASSAGYGSAFSTTMTQNTAVSATAPTGNQLLLTALGTTTSNTGAAGNSIVLSANLSNGAGGGAVGTVNSQLSGGGASVDLNSPTDAETALTTIAAAIATVAAQRGDIGSGINQMNAAVNVMNNTTQNLTSSLSGIQDANIGQVVANMSKYQVLEQTGIAALAQANQNEQVVLKLLP
jgi:flagellin